MKKKSLITFALLFVLGFSMVHEYVFAFYDDNHCTSVEYKVELHELSDHDEGCGIYFEYHQSFTLSPNITLPKIEYTSLNNPTDKETYTFKTYFSFLKPPILSKRA